MQPPPIRTINQLRKCLKYWQDVLGLTGWRISIAWGDIPNAHGLNEFDILHRTSNISVNRPDTIHPPNSVESIVLHELLHLTLADLDYPKQSKRQHEENTEKAINTLCIAFLKVAHSRPQSR